MTLVERRSHVRESRRRVILVAILLGLPLAACGGSDAERGNGPGPGSTTTAAGAERENEGLSAFSGDIVLVNCSSTVVSVDPDTGGKTRRQFLSNERDHRCESPPGLLRGRFNKDFTRFTAGSLSFYQWRPGGVEEVDVSARSGTTGAFDKPRVSKFVQFRPGTDEIWFVDASDESNLKLASTAADGGPIVDRGPYPTPKTRAQFSDNTSPFVLVTRGDQVVVLVGDEPVLANPAGTLAIGPGTTATDQPLKVWNLTGKQLVDIEGAGEKVAGTEDCYPRSWVDDLRFVCTVDRRGGGDFSTLRLGVFAPDFRSVTYRDLLPRAQRVATWAVASPDGKEVAFVLMATSIQQPEAMFRLGLEPGVAPRQVDGYDHRDSYVPVTAVWQIPT